jgi:flavorubredoxin
MSWRGDRTSAIDLFPQPGEHAKVDPTMSKLTQYAPRDAREPQGFIRGITSLADNQLHALQNPFALDGRVSCYPASARGFSVANCYLLTQPDAAMLIDTGFGKDELAIQTQIESLIAPAKPLSMFPLRLNEFMSINNVESFAAHFNVETCYTSNVDAALWFDFGAKVEGRDILKSMKVTAVTRVDTIQLGKGGRAIDVMQAPIRLIATRWLYDRATRTLFSSDMFTHVWRDTSTEAWIVTETDNDSTSMCDIRSFMLNTRYWWLEGAPTDSIRRGMGNVFDKYDIETIAPGYGCILRGRNVVSRHYAMLDEFLKTCDKSVAVSRYINRDEER